MKCFTVLQQISLLLSIVLMAEASSKGVPHGQLLENKANDELTVSLPGEDRGEFDYVTVTYSDYEDVLKAVKSELGYTLPTICEPVLRHHLFTQTTYKYLKGEGFFSQSDTFARVVEDALKGQSPKNARMEKIAQARDFVIHGLDSSEIQSQRELCSLEQRKAIARVESDSFLIKISDSERGLEKPTGMILHSGYKGPSDFQFKLRKKARWKEEFPQTRTLPLYNMDLGSTQGSY